MDVLQTQLGFEDLEEVKQESGPVTCLGMTFANDEERRQYFREELRKKLPELRQIEGFPIGEDEDIIALSDPPYYTACPNPWLNNFIAEWEKEKVELVKQGKRVKDKIVTVPYASDVSEGKKNPIYVAHTYHTKVPHLAIMRYILHYTEPGDIVFDGFAGTGMTGVAANLCGNKGIVKLLSSNKEKVGVRHCLCSDISPLATTIAASYNLNGSAKAFRAKAKAVLSKVEEECGWLYQTKFHGKLCKINYVVWSDKLSCPQCGKEFTLWDVAVNCDKEIIYDSFKCPQCQSELNKKQSTKVKETSYDDLLKDTTTMVAKIPVKINFLNGRQQEKILDEFDYEILQKAQEVQPLGLSLFRMPDGSESRRNDRIGILYAHQFYTRRALIYLSHVWNYVKGDPILTAWFTSTLMNASKMNRYRFHGYGLISGTLYVPSLFKEYNPYSLLSSKIEDFAATFYPERGNSVVSVMSATDLSQVSTKSVDYLFIDPPFGANLYYSELNAIWEWWLHLLTNNKEEAIVDETKTLFDYQRLMNASLKEFYRILKPGKWLTMEFSNTSASVWNSIQNALQGVGFIVVNVAALDKQEGSFKAVTTTTAVKQDLIITCYKPTEQLSLRFEENQYEEGNVWAFIEDYLQHLPVAIIHENKTTAVVERSPKILFDRLISYYVQHGYNIPLNAQDFQRGLRERFVERDGMFFTAEQALQYEEQRTKTDSVEVMGILVGSEAEGIEWIKNHLREGAKTYQQLQPEWMQDLVAAKKGDVLPELMTILNENFIKDEDDAWHIPNSEKESDLAAIRNKRLQKEFDLYVTESAKPKSKIKEVRLEALRYGFKECYRNKDFATIIQVASRIPESLVMEDEVLLQYYDIASTRVG